MTKPKRHYRIVEDVHCDGKIHCYPQVWVPFLRVFGSWKWLGEFSNGIFWMKSKFMVSSVESHSLANRVIAWHYNRVVKETIHHSRTWKVGVEATIDD